MIIFKGRSAQTVADHIDEASDSHDYESGDEDPVDVSSNHSFYTQRFRHGQEDFV